MNFWIFQDKPNKRIAIHRAECGTRNVGQGPPSEGRSWHGPYPNYDEAFGKVKEMSPRKGAQINCRFCHLSRAMENCPLGATRNRPLLG
jgi:Fe-S-cluster-containing dehydrogenase component